MPTDRGKSKEALVAEIASLTEEVRRLNAQIAEFEQREKLMRQKERVLHATLDSAADGILAVNEEGHVVFANRQFARMWHIPPDLIEASDDNELIEFALDQILEPEKFLARIKELYRSFSRSSDTLQFKDGRVFERSSLPLVIEDKLNGRVWTFRDVSAANARSKRVRNNRKEQKDSF